VIRLLSIVLLAGACGFTGVGAAEATDEAAADPTSSAWIASVHGERTELGSGSEPWHAFELSVARRFPRGSIEISGRRVDRDIATDDAIGLDVYAPLWTGAYVNLRAQAAPDATVIAEHSLAVEVFQVVGPAWEVSLLGREDRLPEAEVRLVGGSVARFSGRWSVRARLNRATVEDEAATSGGLHLRRLFGDRDTFVELFLGGGDEVVEVVLPVRGGRVIPDVRRAQSVRLAGQFLLSSGFGLRVDGGYTGYQGLDDRLHLGAGLFVRW